MEHLTKFISSRGILQSCDLKSTEPVSSVPRLIGYDTQLVSGVKSVHVCTEALEDFYLTLLPRIEGDFVLITGDSDLAINAEMMEKDFVRGILEDRRLTKWYAQNLIEIHPKMEHIPIGMDYHSMWSRPGIWGLKRQSPLAQEHSLLEVLSASPSFQERYISGYCNWHFAIQRGDREECRNKIANSGIAFFEQQPISRISTWQRQCNFMLVVSPEGGGIDCHRTWEAILLGCIPVVHRNGISGLFRELPVIILDDWSMFVKDEILNLVTKMYSEQYDYNSLFLQYWCAKINNRPIKRLPKMRMGEFREFLIGRSH